LSLVVFKTESGNVSANRVSTEPPGAGGATLATSVTHIRLSVEGDRGESAQTSVRPMAVGVVVHNVERMVLDRLRSRY
jgi:hypothetical protein